MHRDRLKEEWAELPDFPGYSVSTHGRVYNDDTGREMTHTLNQLGIPMVGLTKNLKQYRRSVAPLVARAFLSREDLTPRQQVNFDTPINLDGDRLNCRVDNLMWRPRWYAVLYHKQFHNHKRGFVTPVRIKETDEWFPNSWELSKKYGLVDRYVYLKALEFQPIWPYPWHIMVDENADTD